MTQNSKVARGDNAMLRWMVILAIAVIAFFGSYRFAQARGTAAQVPAAGVTAAGPAGVVPGATGSAPAAASAGAGCCGSGGTTASASGAGCCGSGGAPAATITKKAAVAGDVQKVSVDLSKGYYDPNTIELKAGTPAEITFGQGSGCLAQVQSQQLGFYQDLQKGAVTIKLPALAAGTYTFTCGMQMQSGTIVVK